MLPSEGSGWEILSTVLDGVEGHRPAFESILQSIFVRRPRSHGLESAASWKKAERRLDLLVKRMKFLHPRNRNVSIPDQVDDIRDRRLEERLVEDEVGSRWLGKDGVFGELKQNEAPGGQSDATDEKEEATRPTFLQTSLSRSRASRASLASPGSAFVH